MASVHDSVLSAPLGRRPELPGTSAGADAGGASAAVGPRIARRAARPNQVLAVAALGAGLAFLDATIVNVAFPDIRLDFPGTSLGALSWIFNAYNIVFAALLVAAGRLADLLGRRKVFHAGVVLFTLASVACALAPTPEALIGMRALQAVGAAITVPASLALVLEAFPAADRAHGVALWSAAAALAAGLGPSLGGLLVELGGWRLAFVVNLPVGLLALAAGRRVLVESRAPGRRAMPDLPGAGLAGVAVAALTLGIVQGEDWGWASPAVIGAFGAAVALGALFVRRSATHRSPIIDLELLRVRSFTVANALTIVGAAGFYAYLLNNVLFLTTLWDYSVLQAGLALSPGPFVAAAVARPASRVAQRVGYRPVLGIGAVVWAGGVTYLAVVVGGQPAFVTEWLGGMVLLGLGAGVTFPLLSSAAVASAPGGRFASATALNSVSRQLGAVLGVALLIVVVGTPAPAAAAAAFDRGWTFAAVALAVVAAGSVLALGAIRGVEAPTGEPSPEPSPGPWPGSSRRSRSTIDHAAAGAVAGPAPSAISALSAVPPADLPTADFLGSVPLFAGFGATARADLAARAEVVRVRAGEWLVREGEGGERLFLVRSGRLEVVHGPAGADVLETLGRGAVIGELAVITGSPRATAVRARRDSDLLAVRRDDLWALLSAEPAVATAMLRAVGSQLERAVPAASVPPPKATTLAVIPLQSGLPVREVCDALEHGLALGGRLARLDGPGALPPDAQSRRLEDVEHRHDQVLLVGGVPTAADPWTTFCLHHADRVLALTGGGPVPVALNRVRGLRGCELLFLEGPAGPRGLGLWHDVLQPRAHHAIPRDAGLRAGVDRVARRMSGRSVGVVLSGGGARGFAHIGVLEELMAAGITVDRVAGTSMGALIGAMFAMGMEPDEIDARCYDEWVRRNPLNDYRMPRVSLIRGSRARAMLRRTVPGSIEQLPLDYFCVSADLLSGELVVHREGRLADAIAASICVPGIAPPERRDGRLLVDGGVLNNLPVELMAATGEGPIIAVDVTMHLEAPPVPSPRNEPVPPTLAETLWRVVTLASIDTAEAARRHADLVVAPEIDGVGLLEFHQLDRMRAEGRRAARRALEAAPDTLFG